MTTNTAAPTTATTAPQIPATADAASAGFATMKAALDADRLAHRARAEETLAKPDRTQAEMDEIVNGLSALDLRETQLAALSRSLAAKPLELAAFQALDPDREVPAIDPVEFPRLSSAEQQQRAYLNGGLEWNELQARAGLFGAYDATARILTRMDEINAEFQARPVTDRDLRHEGHIQWKQKYSQERITFEETELLRDLTRARDMRHEFLNLRERLGNTKQQIPAYINMTRQARLELAKQAERDAAAAKVRDLNRR